MKDTRLPALTTRGRLCVALAAVLWIAGAALGVWALVGAGTVVLAVLGAGYVAFLPTARLVSERRVDFRWRLASPREGRALVAEQPFDVEITLRNHAAGAARAVEFAIYASSAVTAPADGTTLSLALPGSSAATLRFTARADAAGHHALHGVGVELGDRLGLASVRAYFPSTIALAVQPRALGVGRALPMARRAADARAGRDPLRLPGTSDELRELRDLVPGDPFKLIAWKATARTGRLLVRERERDGRAALWLVVDVGGSMREGPAARSRLARAVEVAVAWARMAQAAGDPVGLVTFDGDTLAVLRPDARQAAPARIAAALMEALTPVAAALTEVTDSELVATVARYLVHQDGIDVRLAVAPQIDDPLWARVATGPDGQLYDAVALDDAVAGLLALEDPGAPVDEPGRLRRFCRVRGIELPARRVSRGGRRAVALATALERVTREPGASRVVIVSDLDGLDDPGPRLGRAVTHAARRGHRIVGVAPVRLGWFPPAPSPRARAARIAAEVLGWDEGRRTEAARRALAKLGVRVVPLGPDDALPSLLRRLAAPARAASTHC